jgi:putative ABC transport system substrate-binding protein
VKRRNFIMLLGGAAAAWPLAARAQQSGKVARLGWLRLGSAADFAGRVEALRTGLRELGYVEGKDIVIEFRWPETVDQLSEFAAELVRMNVDIIFASSSIEVGAVLQVTKTIPIVFATHADPVGLGHVASLARPGGNITGLSMLATDLTAKGLEILKEVVPHATRFGVLFSPAQPSHAPALQAAEVASTKLGVALHMVPAQSVEDFAAAFCGDGARRCRRRLRGGVVANRFAPRAPRRARTEAPVAEHVRKQGNCGGGRSHELRARPQRPYSARRYLHR